MNSSSFNSTRNDILQTSLKSIVIASCLMSLTSCRGRVPIQASTSNSIPENAQYLSEDDIRSSIIHTASNRKWSCNPTAPKTLKCRLNTRGHGIVVDIHYNQKEYSIIHCDSKNLHETKDKIHPKYNKWIQKLDQDIYKNLQRS